MMKYVTDGIRRRIREKIGAASHTYIFLDYDGTLTAIRPKTTMARLGKPIRETLENLSKMKHFSIGIISGRRLSDIRSMIHLKGILYAGTHGFEVQGPTYSYTHPHSKEIRNIMKKILSSIRPLTRQFPGSVIEDKGLSICYHYRLMRSKNLGALRLRFSHQIAPWIQSREVIVSQLKKTLEILPNINWNKGKAIRWILQHENPKPFPLYIGDDTTDENAFKELNTSGVTIRVGFHRRSQAQYFLKNPNEVHKFLSSLTQPHNENPVFSRKRTHPV